MAAGLTCLKTTVAPHSLDANQAWLLPRVLGSPAFNEGIKSMFDSDRMSDELRALKVDVTRLLNTAGEEIYDGAKDRAEALADQIRAALAELGETVEEEQEQLQGLVADRPITSLASAFALGVVVGFMLRRH
ncbi:DUF883 family protein [Bradyrhizobium sp. 1(2017)]|uniref:DUF883 family protein n=1 Tax=Bradyrhizobium sp. 1(2017) TaxID=1404888 RepID=UPI001FED7D95|nr:hypothetical protein [Bradyrhizobium sp. 1(2017)]